MRARRGPGRRARRTYPAAGLRGLVRSVAVLGGAVLLAGCGIRATEVPTDFGPAPSRAPCGVSEPKGSAHEEQLGTPVQVYLLCAAQLVTVDRTVRIPEAAAAADRVRVAQALLDELQQPPETWETQAGFSTDVRGDMTVSGPGDGDPDDALRLSTPPEDLSVFALAQIVCTYANVAEPHTDDSVVLGGPGDDPVRQYACTEDVRTRPGTVPEPPQPVRP